MPTRLRELEVGWRLDALDGQGGWFAATVVEVRLSSLKSTFVCPTVHIDPHLVGSRMRDSLSCVATEELALAVSFLFSVAWKEGGVSAALTPFVASAPRRSLVLALIG